MSTIPPVFFAFQLNLVNFNHTGGDWSNGGVIVVVLTPQCGRVVDNNMDLAIVSTIDIHTARSYPVCVRRNTPLIYIGLEEVLLTDGSIVAI